MPAPKNANRDTLIFISVLSVVSALILSLLASLLAEPKALAKELDRSRQMLIAAKILDHEGHFLQEDMDLLANQQVGASNFAKGVATQDEILAVYNARLKPLLLDPEGQLVTFERAHIDQADYLAAYRKTGYYKQPYKLIYKIVGQADATAEGWVIPVNGFGLWDAIYGYLAIAPDGITVIGATWYDQKETPGLGANIADPSWQSLFPGKKIFQADASGHIDFKSAPLGLNIVRGKVSEVYGTSPKSKSAIDGMAGATLTGNGVTDAYSAVLGAYRPFLVRLHKEQH